MTRRLALDTYVLVLAVKTELNLIRLPISLPKSSLCKLWAENRHAFASITTNYDASSKDWATLLDA